MVRQRTVKRGMERHRFGATGREVPVIGQGTWYAETDLELSLAALRRGLDLGMTHTWFAVERFDQ